MSYRIDDLKIAFEEYVLQCEGEYDFNEKIEVHGEFKPFSWLLDKLMSCDHILPNALTEYMEMMPGTTFADAAKDIKSKFEA
jgi:hypothetical protein